MNTTLRKEVKSIILIVLVVIELGVNAGMTFYKAQNRSDYDEFIDKICSNFDYDDNTYRVSGYDFYGTDELIGCNKSSMNGFYSTINSNIPNFFNRVGLSGGANVYGDNVSNTPIVDSLLGVKYIYSNVLINNYKLVDTKIVTKYEPSSNTYYEERNYIYENPYRLEYAYLIDDYNKLNNLDGFKYQNEMFKTITGISSEENVLREIVSGRKNEDLSDSKYIYVQAMSDNNGITINGIDYMQLEPGRIYAFENVWHDDKIDIEYQGYGNNSKTFKAYYLNTKLFEEKIKYLQSRQATNLKIDKSKVSFDINASEDTKLMISIPYEKEWNIYVDGKKVEYEKLYEMFIGLNIKKGKHKVVMKFENKIISYGLVISILDLPIFIMLVNESRKENDEDGKERKNRNKKGNR